MFKILGFLLICCSFLLLACSEADTLGDEPPTEIVIEGTPTWRNGIGELVELKCASCHQVPASSYTPHGTPATMDLRYFVGVGMIGGGKSLEGWIKAGILEQKLGGIRKMPLEYATPLTEREITYLKDWANNDAPE
ncbi:MAG: hypothetical protein VW701_06150 [Deltaproteobacteria bacterium]